MEQHALKNVNTCWNTKITFYLDIWGQCYKTNTVVIYFHFSYNYHSDFYYIQFTLEWQYITMISKYISAVFSLKKK
jgi:hypothetical protein